MPEETVLPVAQPGIEYAYSTNGEDWTADWCSFISKNEDFHRATNASAAKCTMQTPLSLSIQTQ
ncbi:MULTISPECIES: hypothetical protein [unclassified Pseudomonas]|uniref:hypothetical protein n=1 Tax=unclassified Pseudomonas TaxID=196821 RepID=UPI001868BD02|nr:MULTISPECIES: hypothetical protein [unclassified Pseudomonas]